MRRLATLFILTTAAALAAQCVPTPINDPGRLIDITPQQNPLNASGPMKFAIYDAATADAKLWQKPASGGPTAALMPAANGPWGRVAASRAAV